MIEQLSSEKTDSFQRIIYDYYHALPRVFPWRETADPYHILVSEIMLQQTQTERVAAKYEQFIRAFPDFATLASAAPGTVFPYWQGLGYNRRALSLIETACRVMNDFHGVLPGEPEILETLPGIGKTTAGEIAAFAFNYPSVFIETNIRRVFIHFFFPELDKVKDSDILPLVEQTLDRANPPYLVLCAHGLRRHVEKTGSKPECPQRSLSETKPLSRLEPSGTRRNPSPACIRWRAFHF